VKNERGTKTPHKKKKAKKKSQPPTLLQNIVNYFVHFFVVVVRLGSTRAEKSASAPATIGAGDVQDVKNTRPARTSNR
jgi:hypothetical protein